MSKSNNKKITNTVSNPSEHPDVPKTSVQDNGPVSENLFNQIIESGAVVSENGKYTVHCLTIIGQIEGHYVLPSQNKTTKYEHVIPQLVAVEQDNRIDGLLIILNTVGGDVEAGLAIAELVAGMKKPVVSLVLGGGHSIGVPIAVAAKKSFIAKSATMTIHPVRMTGLTLGVPQAFEYFQKMQNRITRFVSEHSDISEQRYNELASNTSELVMDIGTILDGDEAVDEGLVDSVGQLNEAIAALYDIIDQKRNDEKKKNKKDSGKPKKQSK